MPLALTSSRIAILRDHVTAGDRIAYYEQLGEWGFRYGALAVGVVTQETFSGEVANIFNEAVANRSGILLFPNDFAQIGIDLMIRDFNARTAAGSPALRGEELSVNTIENYHELAFARFGVPITAWTPFVALQAQPTQAAREGLWDRLLADSFLGTGAGYAEILLDSARSLNAQYVFDLTGAAGEALLSPSGAFGNYSITRTIGGDTSAIVGGGPNNDRITLTSKGDVALGFAGNDTITGGAGDDRIYGGEGADVLTGGGGADLIDGGSNGSFLGFGGGDVYVDSRDGGARDVLIDIERVQGTGDGSYSIASSFSALPGLLDLRAASLQVAAASQEVTIRSEAAIAEALRDGRATMDLDADGFFAFADVNGEVFLTIDEFNFGDAGVFIEAGREADARMGTGGRDRIFGENNADLIAADAGDDMVFGRDGADEISGEGGRDRLFGQNGDDRLFGDRGEDALYGGRGNDLLSGGADDDRLFGQGGSDIVAGGQGDDRLYGQGGDDTVLGGSGDDRIFAGSGDDSVAGGAGNDRIFLGSGDDVLVFADSGGADQVYGFGRGDRIAFDIEGVQTFTDVLAFASGSRWRTEFEFDDATTLMVYGLDAHTLSEDQFLFV